MKRQVKCVKLGQELEGLEEPPYPDELGQKIFESVSQEAWQMWIEEQTKLINENKLQVFRPEAKTFLKECAQKFFFES